MYKYITHKYKLILLQTLLRISCSKWKLSFNTIVCVFRMLFLKTKKPPQLHYGFTNTVTRMLIFTVNYEIISGYETDLFYSSAFFLDIQSTSLLCSKA